MYFFISLLQEFQADFLQANSFQQFEELIANMPWSLSKDQFSRVLENAIAIEKITPISVNRALLAVFSQSASNLLPANTLSDNRSQWESRLQEFILGMDVKADSPLQNGLVRFAGLEKELEMYVLKEYGIGRVLSREGVYVSCASLAYQQGKIMSLSLIIKIIMIIIMNVVPYIQSHSVFSNR